MIDAILTRIVLFAMRHERAVTIASTAWFVISCASWIPQIPIPEIPYLTDRNSWMVSGPWNAVWWGFVHPALDTKRKQLQPDDAPSDAEQISQD